MSKPDSLTMSDIKRYWGSYEDYKEEQRRCGLIALEEYEIENMGGADYRPNLVSAESDRIVRRPSGQRRSFHLFGR